MTRRDRRTAAVLAGHRGDASVAERLLDDPEGSVRVAALSALDRIGVLTNRQIRSAFDDVDRSVRHRAAELAAARSGLDLTLLLADDDPTVVEVAAWACGEQEAVSDDALAALIDLTTDASDQLVREAGAAARRDRR